MPKKKLLKNRVKEIPPDGEFWSSDVEETFQNAAIELHHSGWSDDKIFDFLHLLYHSVAAEYGD